MLHTGLDFYLFPCQHITSLSFPTVPNRVMYTLYLQVHEVIQHISLYEGAFKVYPSYIYPQTLLYHFHQQVPFLHVHTMEIEMLYTCLSYVTIRTDYMFSPSCPNSSTSRLLGIGAYLQFYTVTLITVSRYTLSNYKLNIQFDLARYSSYIIKSLFHKTCPLAAYLSHTL